MTCLLSSEFDCAASQRFETSFRLTGIIDQRQVLVGIDLGGDVAVNLGILARIIDKEGEHVKELDLVVLSNFIA